MSKSFERFFDYRFGTTPENRSKCFQINLPKHYLDHVDAARNVEYCKLILYLRVPDLPVPGNTGQEGPLLLTTAVCDDVVYLYASKMENHFRRHLTTLEIEEHTFLILYQYAYILEGTFFHGYVINVMKCVFTIL